MARLTTAPKKFTLLVANLAGGGDPSRGVNPTKIRTGFELQVLGEIPREANESRVGDPQTPGLRSQTGLLIDTVAGVPVRSTGTILVADNDFTNPAILQLGPYTITSGEDFTVGGSTALTAAALAAAIDALPQFSASAVLSTVTVSGPFGPNGNTTHFEAVYRGAIENYTLTPSSDFLADAEPYIGPATILT